VLVVVKIATGCIKQVPSVARKNKDLIEMINYEHCNNNGCCGSDATVFLSYTIVQLL